MPIFRRPLDVPAAYTCWLSLVAVGVLAEAMLGGCSSPSVLTTTAEAWETDAIAPANPVDASTIQSSGRIVLVSPSGKGNSTLVIDRELPVTQPGGRWHATRLIGPDVASVKPDSTQTFVRTDDGSVALAEEIDEDEKVEVVFDPPVLVIPAHFAAQSPPVTQQLKMFVYPKGNRSKTRTEGPAHLEIRYAGDVMLRTSAGNLAARRIDSTFTADLSAAKVVNKAIRYYADGLGLVAEREDERSTVLGVVVRNNHSAWIIADPKTPTK